MAEGTAKNITIGLYIQPGAKRSAVVGEHAGRIKISIAAPPNDGRANKELITFLSKQLRLPKRCFEIISGKSSRIKTLAVEGMALDEIRKILAG